MLDGEFRRSTVVLLAARAANRCSNPDCMAITSGPSIEADSAINVGEAAHIYGARQGSARYSVSMTYDERSDPTNGIWLCRNCHKKIDADSSAYPSDLLFEWKRDHEARVHAQLGRASDMRIKVQERVLSAFPEAGYLAQQTILDKPEHWEYKLTAQLLRDLLEPLQDRLRHLKDGFYAFPIKKVSGADSVGWVLKTNADISNQVEVLGRLVSSGFDSAWGERGTPGSAHEIYTVCKLIRDACARCLEIEEELRFTQLSSTFAEVLPAMAGVLEPIMQTVFGVAPWISAVFSQEKPQGQHELKLKFELPPGWAERVTAAMRRAAGS